MGVSRESQSDEVQQSYEGLPIGHIANPSQKLIETPISSEFIDQRNRNTLRLGPPLAIS